MGRYTSLFTSGQTGIQGCDEWMTLSHVDSSGRREVKHVIMRRDPFPHRLGVSDGEGGVCLWLPKLPLTLDLGGMWSMLLHLLWRNAEAAVGQWSGALH